MQRRTKVLIGTGLAAIVGTAGVFSNLITRKFVNIALDREAPANISKTKQYISGSRKADDIANEIKVASEKLEKCGCEEVKITSHDGIQLMGHWKPCENPKRVVIAMHGWRSSWSRDFGTSDDFWHKNNCNVLYPEQRGQNNSGGDYMSFGLLERYDCIQWIKWVNQRCNGDLPIFLFGVSMGGATVLMSASLDLPENVCGIISDCGFTSPHAIWKHVAEKNLHIPYNSLRRFTANDMCRKKINLNANSYSTIEAMKKCPVPVLFIHGTDDKFVPVEMTYENYKACNAPKRLFIVPGADHGMCYYTDREGYENAVRNFLLDYD